MSRSSLRILASTAAVASVALIALTPARARTRPPSRPRLVVLISIDQFRADYLTRFRELYLPPGTRAHPGGFRYLMERGAWYPDCRYEHYRTVTGVGHASLSTGAQPYVHGIVGNSWWDRALRKTLYCVADPAVRPVGAPPGTDEAIRSPANLLSTTIGDQLEGATRGLARTVSLSFKDRAAVLLAGHRADQALWMREATGSWISSTAYCRDGQLPGWAARLNEERQPDRLRVDPWEPQVAPDALARWNPLVGPLSFSHRRTGKTYAELAASPAGGAITLEAARRAVTAEKLGRDRVPDLLTVNLASNDFVGHKYGPDSPEVLDMSVQTDRQLSEFFNFLARAVPGGLSSVTLALSADHGAADVPETSAAAGVPARRVNAATIRAAAESALDARFGADDWIASAENTELYLDPQALARRPELPRERAENVAAAAVRGVPGVLFAVTRNAILTGRLPQTALAGMVSRAFYPPRSGDVVVILAPQHLYGATPGTGTSHGSPFAYDAHVPLVLAGFGVEPGEYRQPVSPARLAPTLAHILGVARPSAADEPLLPMGSEGSP
jgi:hypothetical protein